MSGTTYHALCSEYAAILDTGTVPTFKIINSGAYKAKWNPTVIEQIKSLFDITELPDVNLRKP